MPKKLVRKPVPDRLRGYARVGIVVAVIAAYSAYWVLTPTHLQVAGISTSLAQPNEVHVTLHNPTFKIVTGSISRIEALTDIPNGRGGTTILQSVPGDYPFTILPQSSLQLTVPMNSRALPSLDYDLYLHIDWGGSNITTIKMPKS